MKSKGERERYTQLNAEFQRIARRDKKAFLEDQCKEIEENNRMGKTRDLFKKFRDNKGTNHAKMCLGLAQAGACLDWPFQRPSPCIARGREVPGVLPPAPTPMSGSPPPDSPPYQHACPFSSGPGSQSFPLLDIFTMNSFSS